MSLRQSRDNHIDNIKIFLLFLVAFAHNLIPFKEGCAVIEQLIKFIYLFHMPLFTFCTGYLVRKSKRNVWGYIKKLLLPYLVFQLCYVLLGSIMIDSGIIAYSSNTMARSVIEPSSPLYFLLCMICWRLLCEIFINIRKNQADVCGGGYENCLTIILGILFTVLLSADPHANTMVLPVFYLLPYYYLGYIVEDWYELEKWLEKIPWWIVGMMLTIYIGIGFMVPYEAILFRINIWAMDITAVQALLYKAVYHVAALLGSVIALKVITRKPVKCVTDKSKNGMVIYIGSSFLSPYLYVLIYSKAEVLSSGMAANLCGITIFTLVSIEVLSWNCWKKLYDFVFGRFIS